MYVSGLKIKNLRSIEEAELTLNAPPAPGGNGASSTHLSNVTLLLGDNGAGKTTVLRAIALAALSPVITSGSGYVPFSLVRRVQGKTAGQAVITARLELHQQDGSPGQVDGTVKLEPTRGFVDRFVEAKRQPWSEEMWDERSPAFLLVGYGSTRRAEEAGRHGESLRQKSRMLRYDRVASLFEESVTLVPLSSWLPRFGKQNSGRHSQVVTLMNELLEPHGELLPKPVEDQYLFRVGGSELPFQALSDGYRAYVSWISDLLYHICMGAPSGQKLVDNRGVVLVDEVDLHLHPEWQRHVIPTLARALPKLQFVFTSHSPIVVGTLHRENVFVLTTQERQGVTATIIEPSPAEVFGLSADQILRSEHFGLRSSRNEEMVRLIAERARSAREGDPEAALGVLQMMALGGTAGSEPVATLKKAPRRVVTKGAVATLKKAPKRALKSAGGKKAPKSAAKARKRPTPPRKKK